MNELFIAYNALWEKFYQKLHFGKRITTYSLCRFYLARALISTNIHNNLNEGQSFRHFGCHAYNKGTLYRDLSHIRCTREKSVKISIAKVFAFTYFSKRFFLSVIVFPSKLTQICNCTEVLKSFTLYLNIKGNKYHSMQDEQNSTNLYYIWENMRCKMIGMMILIHLLFHSCLKVICIWSIT